MAEWEVYALPYATHERTLRDNFLMSPTDPHDASMPMDYFVWLLCMADREIVVDTGFGVAAKDQKATVVPSAQSMLLYTSHSGTPAFCRPSTNTST
jgi:hypothetical protein